MLYDVFPYNEKNNQLVIMQLVKSSADDAATTIKSWTIPKWLGVKHHQEITINIIYRYWSK